MVPQSLYSFLRSAGVVIAVSPLPPDARAQAANPAVKVVELKVERRRWRWTVRATAGASSSVARR